MTLDIAFFQWSTNEYGIVLLKKSNSCLAFIYFRVADSVPTALFERDHIAKRDYSRGCP